MKAAAAPGLALLVGLLACASELGIPADAGVGYKLAFTSAAARERFGFAEPVHARLRERMRVADGAPVPAESFSRVFVEAEIAFRLARRVDADVDGVDELRACVASVHPAIELADWRFAPDATPDLAAVEADGAGAHGFVLGPASDPAALDLARATAVLERDGRILGRGQGSDALGSPWLALLWLARELRERGLALEAGEVVLTGALGPVHAFAPEAAAGRYRATIEGLGSVEVEIRAPR